MADWQTVRYDPTYEEPLDPEIVPLCEALNAAGFATTQSCCGHGHGWPYVWFEHSDDQRIESLARFILQATAGDFRPFFVRVQKEIDLDGYSWSLGIHLNNVYADTPTAESLRQAVGALGDVTRLVTEWERSAGASILPDGTGARLRVEGVSVQRVEIGEESVTVEVA